MTTLVLPSCPDLALWDVTNLTTTILKGCQLAALFCCYLSDLRPTLAPMTAQFEFNDKRYSSKLTEPHDISIPLFAGTGRIAAWYVPPISIEPVVGDGFVGSVQQGGSVNFRSITFNPHGHGTHTECLGHITKTVYSVNQAVSQSFFAARLITVSPSRVDARTDESEAGDWVITPDAIPNAPLPPALIIRTAPNEEQKTTRVYNNTNPPYLLAQTAAKIVSLGVEHLLIDLPSVDRERDGGRLRAHHIFFGVPEHPRGSATITELIYVPDQLLDGIYLLNLQTAPFENDATPSRPVLFSAIEQ